MMNMSKNSKKSLGGVAMRDDLSSKSLKEG